MYVQKYRIIDTTKAQQIALDDALVAPTNHLKIGKCNHRLSSDLKSNEPTLQMVLDALKLTPFYNAFMITTNVPEINMQELWAIVSIHHTSLRFKMNDRSHTLNIENFRDMLQICPRLPGQKFEDPSFEEEILSFIRDLSHIEEIHVLTDKKPVLATKDTRLKSKANVTKPDKKMQLAKKTKAKGLDVLSEVSLSEGEQIKHATKRSKKDFHILYASGSDVGTGTIPGVPDVPPYEYESNKESWGDREDEDDNDQTEYEEEYVEERACTTSDYELTDKEKLDYEESMDYEEEDEVIKELYDDVNVNLGNDDTKMTDANQGADNEIASLMETSAPHVTTILEITSGFTTTTPPLPLFFNPLLQQQTPTITTPTFTTITSTNPTVTLSEIPNFAFIFKFDQRMKEAVNVAVQLQTNKLREEDQAENQEFLNQIEKYVTESLGAKVLVRSTNQPQTTYAVAASLLKFELKKILIEKIKANNVTPHQGGNARRDEKESHHNTLVAK
nr:hypothetical protein [Tanacetum cinerariifolium]